MSTVLAQFPDVFDLLVVETVRVGERSGCLIESLDNLCAYLEARREFNAKLRSAALTPALTFLFFIAVTLVIFTVVVPRFADVFKSVGQELPAITKAMLAISDFLRSWKVLVALGLVGGLGFVLRYCVRLPAVRLATDTVLLKVPLIGQLVKNSSLTYFLRSAAMLVTSGMHVVPALAIAKKSVSNEVLSRQFEEIYHDVQSGYSLSQAMVNREQDFFDAELIALISVGQESGKLGLLLSKAAAVYQEKVNNQLTFIVVMVQPLLMIILGLLITSLIFAVYMPILSLSQGL